MSAPLADGSLAFWAEGRAYVAREVTPGVWSLRAGTKRTQPKEPVPGLEFVGTATLGDAGLEVKPRKAHMRARLETGARALVVFTRRRADVEAQALAEARAREAFILRHGGGQ